MNIILKKSKNKETDGSLKYVSKDIEEDQDDDAILAKLSKEVKLKDSNQINNCTFNSLFKIEIKHLNPENEIKRMFGSKVVQVERTK